MHLISPVAINATELKSRVYTNVSLLTSNDGITTTTMALTTVNDDGVMIFSSGKRARGDNLSRLSHSRLLAVTRDLVKQTKSLKRRVWKLQAATTNRTRTNDETVAPSTDKAVGDIVRNLSTAVVYNDKNTSDHVAIQ